MRAAARAAATIDPVEQAEIGVVVYKGLMITGGASMSATARILPMVAALWLGACATAPEPPPPAPPQPEPAPVISSVEPVVPAAKPAPAKPAKPKSKKAEKAEKDKAAAAAAAAGTTAVAPPKVESEAALPPAPAAKPEPEIKGPAWLSRCVTKRYEGGAILCDADSLLANPSGNIKVYARDQNLAGPVANGGRIEYRPGLPRRYRLFVFP